VAAWEDDFTGYVLDYGAYPDQKRSYYTLNDAKRTLQTLYPGASLEAQIRSGLDDLSARLLSRKWDSEDGAELSIERCLVDANWGESTDVVYQFVRESPHAAVLIPSHGRYVGAASLPFGEYKKKQGDRVGHNWRMPNVRGKRVVRYALFDANYWKSFVHARLATPDGGGGCLSLFGDEPETHKLLADHLTAEAGIRTEGRGRSVTEWKIKPSRPDNHWFDCLAGCCVAAAIQGASLDQTKAGPSRRPQRVKLSELQRQKHGLA
jgi:phage terminase large subunit GpA-like protein